MSAVLLVALAVLLWPGRRLPPADGRRLPDGRRGAGRLRRRFRVRRGAGRPRTDGAALAELFAAALDSGLSPHEATRWCERDHRRADDAGIVDDPVQWWQERVPPVARALAVAERLGAPASAAVRAAAAAERERRGAEDDLRSRLAGVRATTWLLTALPAGGLVVAATTVPGPVPPLVVGSVTAGALLTGGGWLAVGRLVGRARAEALS